MSRGIYGLVLLVCLMGSAVTQAATAAPSVTYLAQGWSDQIRQSFYYTPQGSRMIPYAWFLALERTDGPRLFAANRNLEGYGFLPADGSGPLNPDSLPIGFAIDPLDVPGRGKSLGLTCAACHTANVTVGGKPMRIDGAPARIDFDRFYRDLAAAVKHTLFDPAAFQRFAARIVKSPDPAATTQLYQQLELYESSLAADAVMRHPALASGPGRVDALTQIVNSLSVADQSDPRNLRAVGAPTRYPRLWLTPDLEFVQWDPIAASPIGRNGGEALGVFGSATFTGPQSDWYDSSILVRELYNLETWVATLQPPHWDETAFGPIDQKLAATGKMLYDRDCASCHSAPPYRRTDPAANLFGKTFIEIGRVDYKKIGTDPAYVEALTQRSVFTNAATAPLLGGAPFVPGPAFFGQTVDAVVTRAMSTLGLSNAEQAAIGGYRLRPPASPGGKPQPYLPPSFTDLKAGPLAGVWVSGPYLHNGSVATIDELLSPVAQRRNVFWTGGQELDRKRLGYISDEAPGRFRFDTNLLGNRNTGHVYPAGGLKPDERAAIIEYLKTL